MRRAGAALGGMLLLAWAGCGPARGAAWQIGLSTRPAAPTFLDATQFTLRLSDAAGRPVAGATAELDLTMTTMDMGATKVGLAPAGPGLYRGTAQFGMAGDWDGLAKVGLGGRTQTAKFHFKVS